MNVSISALASADKISSSLWMLAEYGLNDVNGIRNQ